jgi:asparagine synthetase B (glutamine-hydrolysing)
LEHHSFSWPAKLHPRRALRERRCNEEATEENLIGLSVVDAAVQLRAVLDGAVQARVTSIATPSAAVGIHDTVDERINKGISKEDDIHDATKAMATVGILFSGGLDCTVIAGLAHQHVPLQQPIDLINVCFDPKHTSPDRQTSVLSFVDLCRLYPERKWRLVAVDVTLAQVHACREHAQTLVLPRGEYADEIVRKREANSDAGDSSRAKSNTSNMDVNIGTALWFAARGQGRIIKLCEAKVLADTFQQNIIASTQHMNRTKQDKKAKKRKKVRKHTNRNKKKQLSQMDSNSNSNSNNNNNNNNQCNGSDGNTMGGRAQKEQQGAAEKSTTTSATPLENNITSYYSPCRVLLSGLGADEYMAGYGRHRVAHGRGGDAELQKELCLDAERLPTRNHGRDDRCISDHGREVRYPYLDEDVIRFLGSIPLSLVVDFSLPRGQGEKYILRNVARDMGLTVCDTLPKRALQFGSRIVRVVEKGSKN